MIDLHTHTFMSDGALSISELVFSEKNAGYEAVAITDHVSFSNYKSVIDAVNKEKKMLEKEYDIEVYSGVELTYVPPNRIKELAFLVRGYGADIVVVHGETDSENVPSGTNRAAIEAGVDILAHPGYLTDEDISLSIKNNVYLEITTRPSHRETNGIIFEKVKSLGGKLVCNNDVHIYENILKYDDILKVLSRFNIKEDDYKIMNKNSRELLNRCKKSEKNL